MFGASRRSAWPINEKAALSLNWRRPGANSAARSTRKSLRGGREDPARWGKRDGFKIPAGRRHESRAAMPETAGKFVMTRFGGLVTRAIGAASVSRETQRVLVERGKIADAIREAGEQGGCRDLQQQSDRGNRPAETPARTPGSSALRTGDGTLRNR